MRLLVTGGAGFIGANFVRCTLAQRPDVKITVLDALTYAGSRESLAGLSPKQTGSGWSKATSPMPRWSASW